MKKVWVERKRIRKRGSWGLKEGGVGRGEEKLDGPVLLQLEEGTARGESVKDRWQLAVDLSIMGGEGCAARSCGKVPVCPAGQRRLAPVPQPEKKKGSAVCNIRVPLGRPAEKVVKFPPSMGKKWSRAWRVHKLEGGGEEDAYWGGKSREEEKGSL